MPKTRNRPTAAPRAPRPFSTVTKPIGPLCNIDCDYCFYLKKLDMFGKQSRNELSMSDDLLKSYIRQYINSQPTGTKEVNFIWQGGEPTLLSQTFYQRALTYQRKFKRPGMEILNSLQTNGTMISDERARFFADNDFLIGISIDGPQAIHNRFRKDRSGRGSFDQVMDGLEKLKKHSVRFNTLTVVQSDNSRYPVEVYQFLRSIGSEFMQFIPIVEPAENDEIPAREQLSDSPMLGEANTSPLVSPRTVSGKNWGSFLNQVFDTWLVEDLGRIFVGHFEMLIGMHAGLPASLCVHSKSCGNAPALEHNGDLFSCDHYVEPEYRLGNIRKEGLARMMQGSKQETFGTSKFSTLPDDCRSCQYLKFCYGGCPKNRLISGQGGNLNWLCSGYKSFYAHTAPVFSAIARTVRSGRPATDYKAFLPSQSQKVRS